jgi:hypothetical protein
MAAANGERNRLAIQTKSTEVMGSPFLVVPYDAKLPAGL